MDDMTIYEVMHMYKAFGLVLIINDGIVIDFTYEEDWNVLSKLTDMIRDTREKLQPEYGAEMAEEIILACYRDSLKTSEEVEKEKKEMSRAFIKGATKYLTKL